MAPSNYRLPALSMIMLGVRSVDNSLAFYRDKLGLSVKQRFEGFAFLDTGAVMLILKRSSRQKLFECAGRNRSNL